jgi:hypothetical protein
MAAAHFDSSDTSIYDIHTSSAGPAGELPLTDTMLRESPSGDLFGLSQNAGMGWPAERTNDRQVLIHAGWRATS